MIVYGERLLSGPGGDVAARALLNLASRLGLAGRAGAGLLEIPASTNGRGLREAGFAAGHGPGYATLAEPGGGATAIAQGLADGDLHTLYLLHADPLRTHPDRALWEQALRHRAGRDRARVGAHRDRARVRDRRLPGRGLRREGGHARAPRRPPAAPARRRSGAPRAPGRAAASAPAGR